MNRVNTENQGFPRPDANHNPRVGAAMSRKIVLFTTLVLAALSLLRKLYQRRKNRLWLVRTVLWLALTLACCMGCANGRPPALTLDQWDASRRAAGIGLSGGD